MAQRSPSATPDNPRSHIIHNGIRVLAGILLLLPLVIMGYSSPALAGLCSTTVHADVVALDQFLTFNRLGAVNPQGMIFALAKDVVPKDTLPEDQDLAHSCLNTACSPGDVKLRDDKRPRPIALRVNEGECLQISFKNLLAPTAAAAAAVDPATGIELNDQPATRSAGIHITGMQLGGDITDDGSNVGANPSSLVPPGGSTTYTVYAEKEDAFVLYSTAANVGGQGGSGTHAFGLFGIVNVEPAGAKWYRSQVTREDLELALDKSSAPDYCDDGNGGGHYAEAGYFCNGQPKINYEARYPATHRFKNLPILNIRDGNTIVHNELNAIISNFNKVYPKNPTLPDREQPFREMSVVFHDEIKAIQAFDLFRDNDFAFTLKSVVDGFAINYGTGGVGAEIIANRIGVGPMHDCVDCKYEEFFLTSWAVGDPAMIVDVPANVGTNPADGGAPIPGPKATFAFYPADPANVWHSYLNDHVKVRNIHVGSEHHIFHLHTHQWLFTPDDDNSNYLDFQAIGPGSAYTYEIAYNGSGNRNKTVGDAIFHCHFYPHFAQGMWGLWRVHDVFEIGTKLAQGPSLPLGHGMPAAGARALPDGEIAAGTPIPAVIPLPGLPMAPMPEARVEIINGQANITPLDDEFDYDGDGKKGFKDGDYDDIGNPGYPFFIAGVAGHRPPTPPLDIAPDGSGGLLDGGLPRHVIISAPEDAGAAPGPAFESTVDPKDFDKKLLAANAEFLPEEGTAVEQAAMRFHEKHFHDTKAPEGSYAKFETNGMKRVAGAPYAEPCRPDVFGDTDHKNTIYPIGTPRTYRAAVIETDVILNKVGWHFNQQRIITLEDDVQATLDKTRPPEPFVIRLNTDDCMDFYHTNLVPNVYQQDDFQVRTPTDVIGQHIHLVKFDVTSSDGAANGWNYEDGTFSPGEVIERIEAIRAYRGCAAGDHSELCPEPKAGFRNVLGARTTIQRVWADPTVNNAGVDRGLGNIFTHDHFGPSTHQQAGLYGTMLVEPKGSTWRHPETGVTFGSRADGGPTSWRADILAGDASYREFFLEFADFQLAYDAKGNPINPPVKEEVALPDIIVPADQCPNGSAPPCPEAISAADPGTFVVNYRNEPIGLRVSKPAGGFRAQSAGLAGDLSYALSSLVPRDDPAFNRQPGVYPPLTADVQPRDPFTPIMRVYNGDQVRIRTQVGATEEMHNASVHGIKWTQEYASPNSGWRNAQAMGISEQFQFVIPVATSGVRAGARADHLYSMNSSVDGFWNGAWGLMRNYATARSDLLPLPNNPIGTGGKTISNRFDFNEMCPKSAPVRAYDVTAVLARDALPGGKLIFNSRVGAAAGFPGPLNDPTAILYVLTEDLNLDGTLKADAPIEPLILRAAAGECIQVVLRSQVENIPELDGFSTMPMIITQGAGPGARHFNANNLDTSPSFGLHAQMVAFDVTSSDGANVGMNNRVQTTKKGDRRPQAYRWYAGDVRLEGTQLKYTPVEFGATNLISSDPIKHSAKGAVGALIIEPQGATWTETDRDHVTGRLTRATATVCPNGDFPCTRESAGHFRDFVVVMQDDINMRLGNGEPQPSVAEQEDNEDTGQRAINYRTEPMWFRLGFEPTIDEGLTGDVDYTNSLSNSITAGNDPQTPIFLARPREEVRFRVLQPAGHNRSSVFNLHGHIWQREPYVDPDAYGDDIGSTAIGNNLLSRWIGTQEGHGPANHFDVIPRNGAGGINGVPGDYLYRDNTSIHFNNGHWGIFRVKY
ncbi:multicopper oxidase [Desulfuromonas versatilis]|uniref:Multicopper oxidase n=1 Tax=Desulfuromonas versatilis TaxID=2802975 RepID=A0ABN6DWA7_9BACT|nr:copper oxidase [Desulfuromonas versatilis]BCR04428.1 multicopper oxidase [Desulfuromonas versatilis]